MNSIYIYYIYYYYLFTIYHNPSIIHLLLIIRSIGNRRYILH